MLQVGYKKEEFAMSKKGSRILIVDDDKHILKDLRASLLQDGYDVYTAETGREAREKFSQNAIDLIVLDIVLPDIDGLEICQWVREQVTEHLPIIILTAKDDDTNQLQAFTVYADDFVTKPFSMPIFLARVKAHLHNLQPTDSVLNFGPLKVDFLRNSVQINEQEVSLTPNEYRILEILVRYKGRLVTSDTLIQKLWSNEGRFGREREVAVYIHNLRRKIDRPAQHSFIKTQHGLGYRFIAEE